MNHNLKDRGQAVDGRFVGSAPSIEIGIREHSITIEKPGFKLWTRAMTVSTAGNASIDATLEKIRRRVAPYVSPEISTCCGREVVA